MRVGRAQASSCKPTRERHVHIIQDRRLCRKKDMETIKHGTEISPDLVANLIVHQPLLDFFHRTPIGTRRKPISMRLPDKIRNRHGNLFI